MARWILDRTVFLLRLCKSESTRNRSIIEFVNYETFLYWKCSQYLAQNAGAQIIWVGCAKLDFGVKGSFWKISGDCKQTNDWRFKARQVGTFPVERAIAGKLIGSWKTIHCVLPSCYFASVWCKENVYLFIKSFTIVPYSVLYYPLHLPIWSTPFVLDMSPVYRSS